MDELQILVLRHSRRGRKANDMLTGVGHRGGREEVDLLTNILVLRHTRA